MKKRLLGVMALLLVLVMVACSGGADTTTPETGGAETAATETEYQYVSGADAIAEGESGEAQIIDLRDTDTYKAGSLDYAVHMDLSKPDDEAMRKSFAESAAQIDKDKKVYFICFSGNKCAKGAVDILTEQGYDPQNLFIIEEGAKGADLSGAFTPQE